MSEKVFSAVIAGTGWIGIGGQMDLLRPKPASHGEAIEMHKGFNLVGFFDTDTEAEKWAKKLYPHVPFFTSYKEMLGNTKPDLVVIATHPDSHCTYILEAISEGVKNILCEKPISDSLEETELAVKMCKEKGVNLQVNHSRRFDPEIRKFRSLVQGEYVRDTPIGSIRGAWASFEHGLRHGGTHIIDLIRFFLGEPVSVMGSLNPSDEKIENDINADAILNYPHYSVLLQYVNSGKFALAECRFIGDRGILTLKDMWGVTIEWVGIASSREYSAYMVPDYKGARVFGTERSFLAGTYDHFYKCMMGEEAPLSSGEEALKTLKVVMAIEKSVSQGGLKVLL